MNQEEFTNQFREKVSNRLYSFFGEEKLSTQEEPSVRKSHAYTFCNTVLNRIPRFLGDFNIAGYKIDDCNALLGEDFVQSERKRLLSDVDTCENIVLFLVEYLRF